VQVISLEWKRKSDQSAFNAREIQNKRKAELDLSNAYADQRALESRLSKTKASLHQQTVAAHKAMTMVAEILYALDEHGLTTEEDDFGRIVSVRSKGQLR
jgi:hypothetical protein